MGTALAAVVAATLPSSSALARGSFDVGLLGDTGYSASQDAALLEVRDHMASSSLAFAVHNGDIAKEGPLACTDARLNYVKGVFNSFADPLVYTPGDNEWSDCPSEKSRLAAIRKTFFSSSKSLGRSRISLKRQSGTPENARWSRDGVWFATLNVPGPRGKASSTSDNVKWLNGTFDAAESSGAAGVMIIWQDDPTDETQSQLLAALKNRSDDFGKPVVIVHGDEHRFRHDRPWSDVPNLVRVETYPGGKSWVKVTVDPTSASVFRVSTQSA
ncbi:MAG: hypothetical protein ACRDV9_14930 [Acidimicrobiia bacterium]